MLYYIVAGAQKGNQILNTTRGTVSSLQWNRPLASVDKKEKRVTQMIDPKAPYVDWKKKATLFLASQSISLFGSSIVNFAIVWHVTLTTASGTMMAWTILASFLPQILISLFAGVWADRYDRRWVIILADGFIALVTLGLALVFMSGHRSLWLLLAAAALRSIGSGIQSPAVSALLPQFVPLDQLMRINGLNGSIRSFMMLFSPAAGGWVLARYAIEGAFLVDVFTALLAMSFLFFLKVPPLIKSGASERKSVLEDLMGGLSYVRGHGLIRNLLLYYAFFFFLVSPSAFLTPLLIARSYGPEVWRLTTNEILYSAGAVAGGALMASWGGFANRLKTIALSCAAHGISSVLLGISPSFAFYLVVIFFTGIFMPMFSAAEMVLIQENVDQEIQGRVFSMIDLIILAVMPFGMFLFGPLADRLKVEILLVITGFLMVLVAGLIYTQRNRHEMYKPS